MTEIVREWPANAAGERACRLAKQRGQLVHAERRGDVVRVVLKGVELPPAPPAGQRRIAGGRRTAAKYVAAGAGIALGVGGVVWGVVELVRWASAHVAQILGGVVALLLIAAVLARVMVGGGDEHPCNR